MTSNVIDLNKTRFEKALELTVNEIESAVVMAGGPVEKELIRDALMESIERRQIQMLNKELAEKSLKETGEAYPCRNLVCPNCVDNTVQPDGSQRTYFCLLNETCYDCLFQMLTSPPSTLNYDDYMPTHQEALDRLEKEGLLSGPRLKYQQDSFYYDKARHNEERWGTEIKGIDFNILRAAILKVLQSQVTATNICLEVEKAMGIFPNIKLVR